MSKKRQIRTKIALAKALRISRSTLDEYLSMPGAPAPTRRGFDLVKIVDFIAARSTKEATAVKVASDLRALRAREISLRCDRLKFRLEVDRGEYIRLADIVSEIAPSLSAFKELLYGKLQGEMPTAASGMDIPQSRIYGGRLAGELLEKLQAVFKAWKI